MPGTGKEEGVRQRRSVREEKEGIRKRSGAEEKQRRSVREEKEGIRKKEQKRRGKEEEQDEFM